MLQLERMLRLHAFREQTRQLAGKRPLLKCTCERGNCPLDAKTRRDRKQRDTLNFKPSQNAVIWLHCMSGGRGSKCASSLPCMYRQHPANHWSMLHDQSESRSALSGVAFALPWTSCYLLQINSSSGQAAHSSTAMKFVTLSPCCCRP